MTFNRSVAKERLETAAVCDLFKEAKELVTHFHCHCEELGVDKARCMGAHTLSINDIHKFYPNAI